MMLDKALKATKTAYIVAIVSATLTLIASIAAAAGHTFDGRISPWMALDAILIYALAYGIYKNSRICSSLMFVYWVAIKVIALTKPNSTETLPIAVIFAYFFFMGIIGTFTYHKLTKTPKTSGQIQAHTDHKRISEYHSWRTN
ncbi:MAG: hypothetical protein ACYTE8_11705 [Planctomycetota bacterium]